TNGRIANGTSEPRNVDTAPLLFRRLRELQPNTRDWRRLGNEIRAYEQTLQRRIHELREARELHEGWEEERIEANEDHALDVLLRDIYNLRARTEELRAIVQPSTTPSLRAMARSLIKGKPTETDLTRAEGDLKRALFAYQAAPLARQINAINRQLS